MSHRQMVIRSFARWAAASAARQGCPIRGRALYPYLDSVPLHEILSGEKPISAEEFAIWHRRVVEALAAQPPNNPIGTGWAAKLVNLLLKVRVYIGSEGRDGLRKYLHPPIDNQLIQTIREKYPLQGPEAGRNKMLRDKIDRFTTIVGIDSYDNTYLEIIDGLREVARRENCVELCEVESLWPG